MNSTKKDAKHPRQEFKGSAAKGKKLKKSEDVKPKSEFGGGKYK